MEKISYIFNLLSRKNRRYRISFFFPWVGIFIGTIMLLLINGIMDGMENKIFRSLNNIDGGYKLENFSNEELTDILSYLNKQNIDYEIIYTRDMIIANEKDYMFVNMIAKEDTIQNLSNNITIGAGISNHLGVEKADSILILSPLDISFSSMKVPSIFYIVDSIYTIHVIEFDQIHVFTNASTIRDGINTNKKILLKEKISDLKVKEIRNQFNEINISYWKDNYLELVSAIRLEKMMYLSFAYMLIFISCLGNFTITNFIITNKLKEISVLNMLGFQYSSIKKIVYSIMLFFAFLASTMGAISFIILIQFGLLNPLISTLFPNDLFYDFLITVDISYSLIILVLNLITVYFSSLVAINMMGKEKTIDVITGNLKI